MHTGFSLTKRIPAALLAAALVAGSTFPAQAASDYTDSTAGSTPAPAVTTEGSYPVDVSCSKASAFTVTIPKSITLSGSSGDGGYAVSVSGDIAGDETVQVMPEKSFELSQKGKENVAVTVAQDITRWTYDEMDISAAGTMEAEGLSAGKWEGSVQFTIRLAAEKASGLYDTSGNLLFTEEELEETYGLTWTANSSDNYSESGNNSIFAVLYDAEASLKAMGYTNIPSNAGERLRQLVEDREMFGETVTLVPREGLEAATDIIVPEGTTSVGYALQYCSSITGLTLPESMTEISQNAFMGCSSLQSVVLPSTLTEIPAYAFYRCTSLTDITIPESVTTIGWAAFGYCTSLDITVPDTVTAIRTFAFDSVPHITYHGTAEGSPWGADSIN